MGGSAFKSFSTPRMPTEVYIRTRDQVVQILRELYVHADCPIEGPGKEDHGDIDILVSLPRVLQHGSAEQDKEDAETPEKSPRNVDFEVVYDRLQALHCIYGSPTVIQYAIPWPDDLLHLVPRRPPMGTIHILPLAIQLDVQVIPNPSLYEWTLMMNSHGDFCPIVGAMIRPFGLTLAGTGLFVSIPGLEEEISKGLKGGRRASRVHLTDSTTEFLLFLGFKQQDFSKPFESVDQFFSFICTCRFFHGKPPRRQNSSNEITEPKAYDETKMRHRNIFLRWIEDFLPGCENPAGRSAEMTRQEVVEEALKAFPKARDEYDMKLRAGLRDIAERTFWSQLHDDLLERIEKVEITKSEAIASDIKACDDGDERMAEELKSVVLEAIDEQVKERHQAVMRALDKAIFPSKRKNKSSGGLPYLENAPTLQSLFSDGKFEDLHQIILQDWEGIEEAQISRKKGQYVEYLKQTGKWHDRSVGDKGKQLGVGGISNPGKEDDQAGMDQSMKLMYETGISEVTSTIT